jgi:transcriptional regulator with PAS, ATPase and Fis domain
VSINCGAIPGELLESELFGHERGAFTGAVRSKPGLFEVARAGTIFLDEIGDMPLAMQVKILRVLQQKEFRRVGGTEDLKTDARVLSASNRDLETMVKAGTFREDLWYRLNVVEIRLPPLRDRREDLPLLVAELLKRHGGESPPTLLRGPLAALLDYDWPGNVRELENEIQRAVALADGGNIGVEALSPKLRGRGATDVGADGTGLKDLVDRFEKDTIKAVLTEHNGRVSAAAKRLGLTRAGLYKKIHKYELTAEKD